MRDEYHQLWDVLENVRLEFLKKLINAPLWALDHHGQRHQKRIQEMKETLAVHGFGIYKNKAKVCQSSIRSFQKWSPRRRILPCSLAIHIVR